MSTILCRQPSVDSSHVVETTTMRLKLVSPKLHNQTSCFAGWSMLQFPSHTPVEDYFNTEINSHLYDQKSLKLSQKSLELCTESLGSETGSDMSNNNAFFSIPTSSLSVTRSRKEMESKKVLSRSFPPPLMTISGSKLLQVRPHRQGGRLVIEAIETNFGNMCCLHAERSHGRLRLTCWKNEKGELDVGSHENEMKLEKNEEDMERLMVIEKHKWVRRCNEDGNGDKVIGCNWEPCCWVAIS